MLSKFKKQIISFICILIIGLPNLLLASPFASDSSLEVLPYNQSLYFESSTNTKNTQTFSVKNTSNLDKRVYVRSYPTNGFEYLGASYVTIPAQSSSYFSINFQSNQTGNFQSELKLEHNDTQEVKTIKLEANVYSNSSNNGLYISDDSINFGHKTIGSRSTASINITNNNSKPVNISHNTVSKPFQVISYPTKLNANETGTITIEFQPESKNTFSKNLVFNTSDPKKTTLNISLTGKSTNQTTQNHQGKLKFSNQLVQFNNITTGTSISKKVTISNPNNFDVEIKVPSNLKKPFKASLQNSVNGSTTLKPNSSKTLTLVFEPTKKQYYEQSIQIKTNLTDNPSYEIKVLGNSIYRGNTQPNPSQPYYPNQPNPTYQPPVINENTSLKITRNTINPDLGEIAYFNFNLGREYDSKNLAALTIKDIRLNKVIYSQTLTELPKGRNDWKIKWDGKNYQGNSVLEGNYEFELSLVSISGYRKIYQGSVNVVRNPAHIPHKITHQPNNTKNCLTYSDVQYDTNLCNAIVFADNQNLLKENQTRFYPKQEVTRAQAISSLVKLFDLEMETYNPKTDKTLGFSDLETTDWFMPFLKTLQKYDTDNLIISGYSDFNTDTKEFKPEQTINRGELYKLFFEVANLETQQKNNYTMDYFLKEKPFKDTLVDSNYSWYTPYAGIAQRNFNGSNFSRKYYGNFQINPQYTKFCAHTKVDKEEFFELLYEANKTKAIQYN